MVTVLLLVKVFKMGFLSLCFTLGWRTPSRPGLFEHCLLHLIPTERNKLPSQPVLGLWRSRQMSQRRRSYRPALTTPIGPTCSPWPLTPTPCSAGWCSHHRTALLLNHTGTSPGSWLMFVVDLTRDELTLVGVIGWWCESGWHNYPIKRPGRFYQQYHSNTTNSPVNEHIQL